MKITLFLLIATTPFAQEPTKNLTGKSGITIDAKARASDYVAAFDMLRKDKPALKIMVQTTSNNYSNVGELTAAPGGTLLFLKVITAQGTKTQIVPVEEIVEINYSP